WHYSPPRVTPYTRWNGSGPDLDHLVLGAPVHGMLGIGAGDPDHTMVHGPGASVSSGHYAVLGYAFADQVGTDRVGARLGQWLVGIQRIGVHRHLDHHRGVHEHALGEHVQLGPGHGVQIDPSVAPAYMLQADGAVGHEALETQVAGLVQVDHALAYADRGN